MLIVNGFVNLDIGVFKIQQTILNQTTVLFHSRNISDCSQLSVDLLAVVG